VRGTSTYPPGAKENGGIFCHANTWAIVAAAKLGWNDVAYDYYRRVLPLLRTDSDRYLVEPYVYCQNVCGPTHPQFGMGRNAWLTGTASWTYVAATQWILGIRPTYRGLRIAPALPSGWSGFTGTRLFRGAVHEILVERSGPGDEVVLEVDGEPVAGDVVPLADGRDRVAVHVRVGASP
jgi:cellobiose phosphorylase